MNPEISPETIRAELERVLVSDAFRGAERSRALLRFIVEEALQGRADRLKDYVLGSEALGRGEKFDPRTDPVARVEASRLRSRLDVYYATEGRSDPVRICLPKGGYAPAFEPRRPESPVPEPGETKSPAATRRGVASTMKFGAAVVVVALAAAAGGWQLGRGAAPEVGDALLDLVTPLTMDSMSVAISPDGHRVVYVASTDGRSRLWVRPIDDDAPRPLDGTEDASLPFWAPDGRSIGFFADSRVKRIDLGTGLISTISTAVVPAGGAWNRDGVILHPIVPDSPLFRTSTAGAPLEMATALPPEHTGHRGPAFLPDGRRFLFHAKGPDVSAIYVGELGSTAIRRLVDADAPAVVAPPDHILYVRHSALFLHRIDPASVTLLDDPIKLAEGVPVEPLLGIAAVSASESVLIYRTGPQAGKRQFMWVDRAGRVLSRIGSPTLGGGSFGSLTRDFTRLAIVRTVSGNTDVYTMDVALGIPARFTDETLPDIAPHWSPTGDRIAYSALAGGVFQLFERPWGGEPRLLLSTAQMKQVTDWSLDGRHLLFRTVTYMPKLDLDIWALPLDPVGTPEPIGRTESDERDAQLSPNGSFVAYQSNAKGRFDIYVKPFKGPGEPEPVSKDGGVQVRWRPDGSALYYIDLMGQLVEVPIRFAPDGRSLKFDTARQLFRANTGPLQGMAQQTYQPYGDGTKFLMDVLVDEVPPPLRVVLNWNRRQAPR